MTEWGVSQIIDNHYFEPRGLQPDTCFFYSVARDQPDVYTNLMRI